MVHEHSADFDHADHADAGGTGDIAAVLHTVGTSFGPAVTSTMYTGALRHARRQRRRTVAGGTLATVAVLGVAGLVISGLPAGAATKPTSPAGTDAANGGSAAPTTAAPANTTSATTTPTKSAAVKPDPDALGKLVLDTAINALPAGSHAVFPVSGVHGPKPAPGHPSTIYATAFGDWSMGPGADGPGVSVDVKLVTTPATCTGFVKIGAEDSCTDTPFPGGGHVVRLMERKDPVHEAGPYLPIYTWIRPDGAEVEVSFTAQSVSQFPWTSAQVDALFALPAWDQAVTELKALVPLPSS